MHKSHHLNSILKKRFYIVCLIFIGISQIAKAQSPIRYDVFTRPSLGGIIPKTPVAATINPVILNPTQAPQIPSQKPNDLTFGNQRVTNQYNSQVLLSPANNNSGLPDDILNDIQEFKTGVSEMEWIAKTSAYRNAFEKLIRMNPDSYSLSDVVFTVENAYFDNKMAVQRHKAEVKRKADIVRQVLKREGLDTKDDLVLNYGIQKLFQKPVSYYDNKQKKTVTVKPFSYDFKDYRGDTNYYTLFVSKMMVMNSGQCHSMPLMYLMIAEELDAQAWLSLAPQHSFVQFLDRNENLLNFETTNGNLVSSNWLLQSGFINANALKEKTYMDTLSKRELFAQCMSDLLLGYMHKFGYDSFAEKIRQTIRSINPQNLTVALIDANLKTQYALSAIKQAGMPKESDLPNYPSAYQAYLTMHQSYEQIDALGYQDMPEEAYRTWLKTIEGERKKQENKELKQRIQQEIKMQRRPRSTVIDRTKG